MGEMVREKPLDFGYAKQRYFFPFSRINDPQQITEAGGPDLQVDWIFCQAAARCCEVGLAERQDEFHEFFPRLGWLKHQILMAKTDWKI